MTFLGLAWVVSYMGSFYAPQAFLNSTHHLFATPNSATPAQPPTGAIANSNASFGYSSGSQMWWLPRPQRSRLLSQSLRAVTSLPVTVVQTPQSSQAGTVNVTVKAAAAKPVGMNAIGTLRAVKAETGKQPQIGIFRQCISSSQTRTVKVPLRPSSFQVRIKGQPVAELPDRASAAKLATRLRDVLDAPGFDPSTLQLSRVKGLPAGKAGQRSLLFTIDPALEAKLQRSGDLIAIDWINNLRTVLGVAPLPLAQAQTQLYALSATRRTLKGTASWYGPYFHNRLTAAGERFDQYDLTAAHPSLAFDTYLKVTNQKSGNSVIVRINDRGPYVGTRSLDLSRQAARCIGSETAGVVPYSAIIMQPTQSTGVEELTVQSSVQTAPASVKLPASALLPSTQKLAKMDSEQN